MAAKTHFEGMDSQIHPAEIRHEALRLRIRGALKRNFPLPEAKHLPFKVSVSISWTNLHLLPHLQPASVSQLAQALDDIGALAGGGLGGGGEDAGGIGTAADSFGGGTGAEAFSLAFFTRGFFGEEQKSEASESSSNSAIRFLA